MKAALEQLVRKRANGRSEYCSLPQAGTLVPFEIDHIISRKHRGRTVASNLANFCLYCNAYKGPNIAGLDLATFRLNGLFHPRRHKWTHHLRYHDGIVIGRTAIGRTTVELLQINLPNLVALHELLVEDGLF